MTVYYFDIGGTICRRGSKPNILKDVTTSRKELRRQHLIPSTFQFIQHLRYQRNVKLGIITNTSLGEEGIDQILRKLGIRSYFKEVVVSCNKHCRSNCKFRKPYKQIFEYAKSLFPRQTEFVYIGTHQGARKTGFKTITMSQVKKMVQ